VLLILKDKYEKELETKKILQSIQSGLEDIKNGKNIPIDKL